MIFTKKFPSWPFFNLFFWEIIQLFLRNDIFTKASVIATGGAGDLDTIAHSLVNIFAATTRIFEFLLPLIETEVSSTGNASSVPFFPALLSWINKKLIGKN